MGIERIDNGDGTWTASASGKDVRALSGAFGDVNAREKDTRMEWHRDNPSRKIKRGSQERWANPDKIERERSRGWEVSDAVPGIVMSGSWVGMAADGRIVYASPVMVEDGWEMAWTVRGEQGWARSEEADDA